MLSFFRNFSAKLLLTILWPAFLALLIFRKPVCCFTNFPQFPLLFRPFCLSNHYFFSSYYSGGGLAAQKEGERYVASDRSLVAITSACSHRKVLPYLSPFLIFSSFFLSLYSFPCCHDSFSPCSSNPGAYPFPCTPVMTWVIRYRIQNLSLWMGRCGFLTFSRALPPLIKKKINSLRLLWKVRR